MDRRYGRTGSRNRPRQVDAATAAEVSLKQGTEWYLWSLLLDTSWCVREQGERGIFVDLNISKLTPVQIKRATLRSKSSRRYLIFTAFRVSYAYLNLVESRYALYMDYLQALRTLHN